MDFLNDFGKKIGDVASATAAKAKELAELAKLNSEISSKEREIEKNYIEIGKFIYEQAKNNEDSGVREYCQNIQVCEGEISQLEARVITLKNNGI